MLTFCSYGDSISAITYWQKIVKILCGFKTIYNRGVGGSTYAPNNQYWFSNKDGSYYSRPVPDRNIDVNKIIIPEGKSIHEGSICSEDRIKTMFSFQPDVITIMGGTNDFYQSIGIEEFKKSVIKSIQCIGKHCSKSKIILISPIYSGDLKVNNLGLKLEDYANAIEEVSQIENLPFIDLFHKSLIKNQKYLLSDSIHPNKLGSILIGICISKYLSKIIKN